MMELLRRSSGIKVSVVFRVPDGLNGLNEQRSLPSSFGGSDEGSATRHRKAIREKIETEPKIRKDLTRPST